MADPSHTPFQQMDVLLNALPLANRHQLDGVAIRHKDGHQKYRRNDPSTLELRVFVPPAKAVRQGQSIHPSNKLCQRHIGPIHPLQLGAIGRGCRYKGTNSTSSGFRNLSLSVLVKPQLRAHVPFRPADFQHK